MDIYIDKIGDPHLKLLLEYIEARIEYASFPMNFIVEQKCIGLLKKLSPDVAE